MPVRIIKATIKKESAQKEIIHGTEIPHPYHEEHGDMISYYNGIVDVNPYHCRCLDIKADCTTSLGINVVEGDEKAVLERLLIVNDDGESFEEIINRVALDYETTGNGYLEGVRGRGGLVQELYFCPAIETWRRPRDAGTAFLYRSPTGQDVNFPRFDATKQDDKFLIHFAQATQQNRHYGLPSWRGIIPDIVLDDYATRYNQKFFINSGIPDLAIIVEGGVFDEPTEKAVVEFVQNNFKGLDNAHRTLYLPVNQDGVKVRFEKLGMEIEKDGSFTKLRESCRDRILAGHGVPPRLAGVITTGQIGGGGEVDGQIKIFQETTISPRQRYFEGKLNPLLTAMGINGKIAFEGLDVSNTENTVKQYTAQIVGRDEARASIGYEAEGIEPEIVVQDKDKIETLEKIRKAL